MMKATKISLAILVIAGLVNAAQAAKPGFYAGAGLGYSNVNAPNVTTDITALYPNTSSKQSNNGLAGRLFAGYNFNRYFGLEAGYAQYADVTVKTNIIDTDYNIKQKLTSKAFDVVGKAYLPIKTTGFDIYALAGISHMKQSFSASSNITGQTINGDSNTKNLPILGVGASYQVTNNVITNLEFTHVNGSGNMRTSDKAIAASNLVTLNLAYNFG